MRQLQLSQQQFSLSEAQLQLDRSMARADLRLAEESQITERYIRAIELIGSPEIATRLGGISSLEQIANQSESHRTAVIDILEGFVRSHSPWILHNTHQQMTSDENLRDQEVDSLPPLRVRALDVQAAVKVLGHFPLASSNSAGLELSNVDLRGADLAKANLQDANLSDSNLQEANLSESILQGANLSQADLRRASLAGADLQRADLSGADLLEARVQGANFSNAYSDGRTRWPEGFEIKAADAIQAD